MIKKVQWLGSTKCDFCNNQIDDILIDGVTIHGPWATMCESCHKKYGYNKFGTGLGQKYKKNEQNEFVKIEE